MGCVLYENEQFQSSAEGMLRPGGLELTRQAVQDAHFLPGATLLDAGCGLGTTVAELSRQGFSAFGLERSAPMLKKAEAAYPGLAFRLGDVCRIPWEKDTFDGIVCECTFSTVEDKATALKEMHRVLKPGGRLLLSDFYQTEPFAPNPEMAGTCLWGAAPVDQSEDLLTEQGFEKQSWQDATDHLRSFVASLVWQLGSLEKLQALLLPGKGQSGCCRIPWAKLGYSLSMWKKVG